ncbi:MAG TPA: alpha-L-rhamnosidase C-terminal domain-containing protein [Chitinophagaceae bacterium]|nr:alpha-L-rhamnosidase C-terminal domain-containing protein [Chitinophagaceae bacterium]
MSSDRCLRIFILPFLILFSFFSRSQTSELSSKAWDAWWISVPGQPAHDYGVYQFRKTFTLGAKPDSFIVHISADNRYKLFVNGQFVSLGPARGDIFHWNFETLDLGAYLQAGKNVIAAVVWNYGELRPEAQISYQTGFIMQGNSPNESIINTNTSWKCRRDSSYSPKEPLLIYSYYVAGPGETINYNLALRQWKEAAFDDRTWPAAAEITQGLPKGAFGYGLGWMLMPRSIPQMELTPQRLQKVRQVRNIQLPQDFPQQKKSFTIPSNANISILLDQGFLTDAYPVLQFSKGKSASITLAYAEGLYIEEPNNKNWRTFHQKGNRNDIEGKRFIGVKDSLISDGSDQQEFTSLWWRTYRYMQLEITTKDEPLVINDLYGVFTGYPFAMKAQFDAGNDTLNKILETGWRTARSCAMETYMDCPYYEQLQYVGDTRIQCLVSLYNSGDDRLMRNAITLIDDSRMAEGATLSRYPTANAQEIPPFSLWWIGMLHDYWMYRNDEAFIKSKLPGVRQVLWFFSKYQQPDGSLKHVPYWNFTDWCETKGWNDGVAPVGKDGSSAALDLQLLWAYELAADLENSMGMREYAQQYVAAVAKLKQTIRIKYWDAAKKLFADTPEKDVFSQHTNSLAILTGVVNEAPSRALAQRIILDTTMTQATIYFKFYVHRALTTAGLGNDYLNWLGIWKQNLAMGMTTWAEISDINNTRSDCHAWGASPNIELYRIVLGIDTDSPGFKRVKIIPHLGTLTRASGTIPHPAGNISASYENGNGKWKISITLPPGTPGYLLWKAKRYQLNPGKNSFAILRH